MADCSVYRIGGVKLPSGPKQGDSFFLGCYDVEEQRESQQIEDIEDIGTERGKLDVTALLTYLVDMAQKKSKARAGYIPKVSAIYDDLMIPVVPALPEGGLEFRCGMGIEFTCEIQYFYSTGSMKSD